MAGEKPSPSPLIDLARAVGDLAAKRQADFLQSDADEGFAAEPSILPYGSFSGGVSQFHRDRTAVGGGAVDVITKRTIRTSAAREKPFDKSEPDFFLPTQSSHSFCWRMPKDKQREARRYGLLKTSTPLSMAISELGHYRRKVLVRAHESGVITNLYAVKNMLVDVAQDTLESVLTLEQLGNTFDSNKPLAQEKARIDKTIQACMDRLRELKGDAAKTLTTAGYEHYDDHAIAKLEAFYDKQIARLSALCGRLKDADADAVSKMMMPTGPYSIMSYAKAIGTSTLANLMKMNQNVTMSYMSGAVLRGDLHSYAVDAFKAIRDYQADPYNPILPEHQGEFPAEGDSIVVDYSDRAGDSAREAEALYAIMAVSGVEAITPTEGGGYQLGETALATVSSAKWSVKRAASSNLADVLGYRVERTAGFVWNVVSGLVLGAAIDLPVGLLTGIFTLGYYKPRSVAEWVHYHTDTGAPKETQAQALLSKLKQPAEGFGTLMGRKLGEFASKTVLDAAWGIVYGIPRAFVLSGEYFVTDFVSGGWGRLSDTWSEMPTWFDELAKSKKADIENGESRLFVSLGIPPTNPQTDDSAKTVLAVAPYALDSGEFDDLLNVAGRGMDGFLMTFLHNIHAKHPVTGLLFNAVYASGGFAVMMPGMVSFLPKAYITFSQGLGQSMAQGTTASAISSGFTQAEIMAGGFEGALHGHDSWLATVAGTLETRPADIVAGSALAISFGYALCHLIDIPYVSEMFREELSKSQSVVELSLWFSSPNRTCTFQRIRLSIYPWPTAIATSV